MKYASSSRPKLDPRRDPRLVEEHVDEGLLLREVIVDALERDEPGEAPLAPLAREVDATHAALGQLGQQLIRADAPGRADRARIRHLPELGERVVGPNRCRRHAPASSYQRETAEERTRRSSRRPRGASSRGTTPLST